MAYQWDREESVGGWGYRTQLTGAQQAEIDTCLSCPLSECQGMDSPLCPLNKPVGEYKVTGKALVSAWWQATAYVA